MKVRIQLLHERATMPEYAYGPEDACVDLRTMETLIIEPFKRAIADTGIAVEIPAGYEMQVRGRSGLAFKHGCIAHLGTIDAGYRGQIRAMLLWFGENPTHYKILDVVVPAEDSDEYFGHIDKSQWIPVLLFEAGARICQAGLRKCEPIEWELAADLSESVRGANGYGSSGL